MFTRWSRSTSNFYRWVHAENLCSILNLVYFDSWSWHSFVSTCDVFNCLFPLDLQNEMQLLWGVFCYSWLVCLLGFWLRKRRLSKSEIRFRMASFSFSPCLMRKRIAKSEAILALLNTFQELHLEWVSQRNYCIWCLFFVSNLMKSSVVYTGI